MFQLAENHQQVKKLAGKWTREKSKKGQQGLLDIAVQLKSLFENNIEENCLVEELSVLNKLERKKRALLEQEVEWVKEQCNMVS